jgi:hypothetical protein
VDRSLSLHPTAPRGLAKFSKVSRRHCPRRERSPHHMAADQAAPFPWPGPVTPVPVDYYAGLGKHRSARLSDHPFNICCFIRISSHGKISMIHIQLTRFLPYSDGTMHRRRILRSPRYQLAADVPVVGINPPWYTTTAVVRCHGPWYATTGRGCTTGPCSRTRPLPIHSVAKGGVGGMWRFTFGE